MKIGRTFTISGHKINVKYSKSMFLGNEGCWAIYDDDTSTIWVRKGMPPSRKAEVLLHEVIHAISYIHGFDISEKAVNTLAIEMIAFFRTNKLSFIRKILK